MKIAVSGTGYVGLVTGVCLAEVGHSVTCVDIDENKINLLKKGISPIYEPGLDEMIIRNFKEKKLDFTTDFKNVYKNSNVIFVAVSTPEREDGSANLDYVFQVSREIAENVESDCLVVIKSTVPIGTNDRIEEFLKETLVNTVKIEVASNPEFLSQGTAIVNTMKASRIIIGVESKNAENTLRNIYDNFNVPIVCTN